MNHVHRARTAAALLTAALLIPASVVAAEPRTIVLDQQPPVIAFHDLMDDGWSPGDLFTFHADVVTADGRPVHLAGDHHNVSMPEDGPFEEHRVGAAVLDFGNGDAIVFAGATALARAQEMIEPGVALVRAIVGGTGAYAGARGQIRSVRDADGTWQHTLTFAPAEAPSETATIVIPFSDNHLTDLAGTDAFDVGDLRSWHSQATTEAGDPAASFGIQYVTRVHSEDARTVEAFGYAVIALGPTDRIVSIAAHGLALEEGGRARAVPPITNAILGGTGRYAGVGGTFDVARNDDGTIALTATLSRPPADAPVRTLVLRTALLPDQVVVDHGAEGDSRGDGFVWETGFSGDDGATGVARGYVMTLDIPSGEETTREVAGQRVFSFDDGSTIVVLDFYVEDVAPEVLVQPETHRAVIGGTGLYAGVTGEMVTTVGEDGELVHTLTLIG